MRACPSCRRHVRDDEPVCPFCSAALPAALPELASITEERLAPTYGGPPLRRPIAWIVALLLIGAVGAAFWIASALR